MELYNLITNTKTAVRERPVVALGNFDGVHIGHQRLLAEAVRLSFSIRGSKAMVWTFLETPRSVIGATPIPEICTVTERMDLFRRAGVTYCALEHFDTIRELSPEEFVDTVLVGQLSCAAVVCGFNFRFGKDGSGDAAMLKTLLAERDIPLTVIDPVTVEGTVVSSTHIRALIEAGEMEEAAKFLGYSYFIDATVLHGKQLGRTMGFPTINQSIESSRVRPKSGVYCTTCDIGEDVYVGITNIGSRPTVNEDEASVNCETYIVGTDEILYGRRVRVNFYRRLRDEKKFDSVEALQDAIARDKKAAEDYFCFL